MDFDADAPGAYTNRAARRGRVAARDRTLMPAPSGASTRAVDRMLLALRAYEQRAQRRAALRLWVIARRAAGEASRA